MSDNRCTAWIDGIPKWLGGSGNEWVKCCQAHDVFYETHDGWLEFIGAHYDLAKCVADTGHPVMAVIMFVGLITLGAIYLLYLKAKANAKRGMKT